MIIPGQGELFAWCPVHGWVSIGQTDGPVLHLQQAPAPCAEAAGLAGPAALHQQRAERQRGADEDGAAGGG